MRVPRPERYAPLLLACLVAMIFGPPLDEAGYHLVSNLVTFPAILLAALFVLSGSGWWGRVAVAFFAGSMLVEALQLSTALPFLPVLARLGNLFFLSLVLVVVLRGVAAREQVQLDTVLGGISGYLIIGFLFVAIFSLVETLLPGSFMDAGEPLKPLSVSGAHAGTYPSLFYYSFVTLSTLGYGDVTPVRSLARALSSVEAVAGQLYVAVLIAALVSQHLADRQSDRPSRS